MAGTVVTSFIDALKETTTEIGRLSGALLNRLATDDINLVVLRGRLITDPFLVVYRNGKKVCTADLELKRGCIGLLLKGKAAQNFSESLSRTDRVLIEGELSYDSPGPVVQVEHWRVI